MELRVERERAVVRFAPETLASGVAVEQLSVEAPRPGSRVDVGAGPSQFRHELCDLDTLEVSLDAAALAALRPRVRLEDAGIAEGELALRAGFAELGGRVAAGARFTCRIALAPGADEALRLAVVDPRVHAASGPSSAALAMRVAHALAPSGAGPGAIAALTPLRGILLEVLPRRGFKLPRVAAARLASARISPEGIRVGWARWAAPPALPPDPETDAALDGARSFPGPEALLARGDERGALNAWLALPGSARAHPFAAARTLSLLSADPARHPQARSLAHEWLQRDPNASAALLAQGLLAAKDGDALTASRAFAALARGSRARGMELAVLAAGDACAALGADADPAALAAALEAALEARRSHLPALRALHDLGRRTLDRATLLRACRGIAAHARDAREKARAHARLALLLAGSDPAAARMHLANAQRLGPEDPETRDAAARLGSR